MSEPQEKIEEIEQVEDDFGNGFPGGFEVLRGCLNTAPGNRSFSWRLPQEYVSIIVRRAGRSRVRLTDRAFILKERAPDTLFSLN